MPYTRDQIYDAMRKADQAGDADAVRALSAQLKQMDGTGAQPSANAKSGEQFHSYGAADLITNKMTGGLGDKAVALANAAFDWLGLPTDAGTKAKGKTFGDYYQAEQADRDARKNAYQAAHPVVDWATLPTNFMMGAPTKAVATTVPALAKVGATYGLIGGAGSSRGSLKDQIIETALSTLTGTILSPVIGKGVPAIASLFGRTTPGTEAAAAANRLSEATGQNVKLMPADVGGPVTKMTSAAVSRTPIGLSAMAKPAEESSQSIINAAEGVADMAGQSLTKEGAGDLLRAGAKQSIVKSRAIGGNLYDKAASLAGDTPVAATGAVDLLDGKIAELSKAPNTNKSAITFLNGLRADLVDAAGQAKPLDIATIRNIRTGLHTEIGNLGLRSSPTEAFAAKVLDEAGNDINDALVKAGKLDAAKAYTVADTFWKNRVDTIDQVLAPILGKSGNSTPNQAFDALMAMGGSKGDSGRLSRLLGSLKPEEAGAVRATVIQRLGQETPGAGAGTDVEFSPARFLTNWKKLSPEAKASMFGGDPRLRSALDDLATVTAAKKAAGKFINTSNSGTMVGTLATGMTMTQALHPVTWTLWGMNYGAGKLLSSQAFVRWLSKSAQSPATQAAARARLGELSAIAASSSPVIRQEILGFQKSLLSALNDNAPKVAAASEGQKED